MKNIIYLSIFFTFNVLNSFSQLKDFNYLIIDSSDNNFSVGKGVIGESAIKVFQIKKTGFKYEESLNFFYYGNSIGLNYCCNYYEAKDIPKEWNIITVKDIVAHMEDKSNGFRFNKKKLFFVIHDSERRIYKAYQVDIIGWPRED
jgi:hypothetical protein